eukprot:2491489-Alexandrium_andersonii.AAC.1
MVNRATRAVRVCERLAGVPAGVKQKQRALRGKVLPMALYAAECTPVPACTMSTLKVEMKRALDVGTQPAASGPL